MTWSCGWAAADARRSPRGTATAGTPVGRLSQVGGLPIAPAYQATSWPGASVSPATAYPARRPSSGSPDPRVAPLLRVAERRGSPGLRSRETALRPAQYQERGTAARPYRRSALDGVTEPRHAGDVAGACHVGDPPSAMSLESTCGDCELSGDSPEPVGPAFGFLRWVLPGASAPRSEEPSSRTGPRPIPVR
jgi:hypothetical protein